MADDLDDSQFVLDNNLGDDDDDRNNAIGSDHDDDDDEDDKQEHTDVGQKRKATTSETHHQQQQKKAKKQRMRITDVIEAEGDKLDRVSHAIDEFVKYTLKHMAANVSGVERSALALGDSASDAEAHIRQALLLKHTEKMHALSFADKFKHKFEAKLAEFVKQRPPAQQQQQQQRKEKKNEVEVAKPVASPLVLVLCSSALRCIEVQKQLDAKLDVLRTKRVRWLHAFAKHKKLGEQVSAIKQLPHPIDVVYATPQRFAQLVEAGCFGRLEQLAYVVVDHKHRDCKLKRFFDQPDIRGGFLRLLFTHLLPLNSPEQSRKQIKLRFFLA